MYGEWSALYDQWCECYDINNNEIQVLGEHLSLDNKIILDIGCGTGRLTFRLAERAQKVIGVDIDKESTAVFKEKVKKLKVKNVELISAGIESVDFQNESLDIVVFSWSFYSLPDSVLAKSIHCIKRWLKTNGKLLILQPDSGQFEEVMRSVFVENQGHEEYIDCFEKIKLIEDEILQFMKEFDVRQNFEFTDIDFGVDAIRMFAITEGSYTDDPHSIPSESIIEQFEKYRQGERFVLDDYVRGFIFEKH